ncbi:hypothetical protein [Shewanella sp. FJAT-52076]|uniref:hypothetical protein n=1 Tax=Shewanella sp. FJAT-52076 TaxID=2864202 RepID=UPI001C6556D9|nr:hypothetical protein [Shewanella sp. FJAT-52076]QYJ75162.1 hypothetical protein K0H79_17765 [Shewanella sp. FJAT-52076]
MMKLPRLFLAALLLTLSWPSAATEPLTVRYVDASVMKRNPNNAYFGQLLQLALEKSKAKYGPYQLAPLDIDISQRRHFRELNNGVINVFWTMTNYRRELDALPVRVPLMKGVYGLRLLAANEHDLATLAGVQGLGDFAPFTFLQGRDWPDTQILRLNRLEVSTDVSEGDMYEFTRRHPGYLFPRAVTELYSETESRNFSELAGEEHLLIRYPAVMYFFVAKQDTLLAQRLEYGLKAAMADGSFDQLFYGFAPHRIALKQAQLHRRKLLTLDNPLLPESAMPAEVMKLQDEVIAHLEP